MRTRYRRHQPLPGCPYSFASTSADTATWQDRPARGASLCSTAVTSCLQSTAKVSSTVRGLGRGAPRSPSEYGNVQARWCRSWVSSRLLHWIAVPEIDVSQPDPVAIRVPPHVDDATH